MTSAAGGVAAFSSWLGRLWRRGILRACGESDKVQRAHDALVDVGAAAERHLAERSTISQINLRCAYDGALFFCERIADGDVRALGLHAAYQCARALNPVALSATEAALCVMDDVERAYEAARRAMLEYLEEIGGYL